MKISFLFLVLFLWVNKAIFAQTSTENYVLSRTYKNKGMSVEYTFPGTPATFRGIPSTVQTGITYLDGLGKTKLEVAAFTSPNQKDILVQTEYDALHRPVKNYLPIASGEGNGKIRTGIDYSYYNGSTICTPTPNAYLKIGYEESPLSRVIQQIAPGVSINDASGVRTGYKINSDADKVYQYQMNDSDDGIAASPGFYAANTLNVIESKDEDNKLVREYRDRYNRVVLKRIEESSNEYLDTYYVYDQKGQLRFVLQPQYQVDKSEDKLAKLAFQYTYDNQGRMTSKRVPGTDAATTMSYYDNDLLRESTDAKGQTFKYTYDELNRPKKTLLGNSELIETYYDGYSFITGPVSASLNFLNELGLGATDFVYDPKENSRKGMLSGSRVRLLNANGSLSDTWLYSATYYDNKYRVIQTVRELYGLGSGAYERVSYKRDFTGKVLVERITQSTSANLYTLEKKYGYDHADRLTYVTHKVMEGSEVKKEYNHFTLTYNEIGQLTQKSLHGNLQALTYKYTPRGWVCSIDKSAGQTFNVGLEYNSNGNINKLSWGTPNGSGSFNTISYDGANRLKGVDENSSPYKESNITYDRNGNILTLQRSKDDAMIDNLSYDAFEGNRLLRVQDQSGNTEGFKDNSNAGNDYAYDANGNLTQDQNKGISAVAYNLLNLTGQVTINGQTVSYIYDAAGNKHQMQAATSSGSITTNYEGIFEYTTKIENSTTTNTMRIGLEEGQLIRDGDNYTVNYYLKDHLGNVRTVIDETGAVLQETDYYPFGLPVVRSGSANNKYLFNGIEIQPETNIYLANFRGLDPQIGRWWQIDPKPDHSMSLYVAMNNNPIRYTDPLGDTTIVNNRGTILKQYGGDNIIHQQGRKGKLTQIGEFGKSINLNGILPNIMRDNKEAAKKMGAFGFANAVRPGGKWDYKNVDAQKGNIFGATAKYEENNKVKTSFIFNYEVGGSQRQLGFKDGSDIGNLNYGYTGKYVGGDGFLNHTLWYAAGILQYGKDYVIGEWSKATQEYKSYFSLKAPYGDEADDYHYTTFGMNYAEYEKNNR